MIALGLFFGLRSLAPAGPPVAPAPGVAVSPPPAPPPSAALDPAVSQRHVADALAQHRGMLHQECYLPAIAGQTPQPTVSFELNFTFDPEGNQITRGLVEIRGASRPEVTQCLLATLPPLRIPRPGQLVTATVPLSFPP